MHEGIDGSNQLELIQTVRYVSHQLHVEHHPSKQHSQQDPLVVWVDWDSLQRDCHVLERIYQQLRAESGAHWLLVDGSSSARHVTCPTILEAQLVKRSVVQGRVWDGTWVHPGRLLSDVPHVPHVLRERLVTQLERLSPKLDDLVRRRRKNDVVMHWRKGDRTHYSQLRRAVAATISQLGVHGHKKLKWMVRLLGDGDRIEDLQVEPEYVQSLVATKIVVVAQHDEWEDHYRLLEALASGALVLSDPMLSPPTGLENGTDIVYYDSPSSLQHLIGYYLAHDKERLAIAKRGQALALSKHRAWHRMEQVLFGK